MTRPSIDHGLLSPSGHISKRARKAALERKVYMSDSETMSAWTETESGFEVRKQGRHWALYRHGKPYCEGNNNSPRHQWLKTRKSGLQLIADIEAAERYRALVTAQDKTGEYHWTAEEEKQIADYAVALAENAERWYWTGKMRLQDAARLQHEEERKVIEGPRGCWLDPDRYFAEKRRTRAARVEAFRRAGLTI